MQWLGMAREHLKSAVDKKLVKDIEDNLESKGAKHIIRLNCATYNPKHSKSETDIRSNITLHLATHQRDVVAAGSTQPKAFLGTAKGGGNTHAGGTTAPTGGAKGNWPWQIAGLSKSEWRVGCTLNGFDTSPHGKPFPAKHNDQCFYNCGKMGHLVERCETAPIW
jgi:hypothetical protein